MEYTQLNLDNNVFTSFKIIKHIGKGSFSNVYLCKENYINSSLNLSSLLFGEQETTKNLFIIKEINIDNLVLKYIRKRKKEPFERVIIIEQHKSAGKQESVAITPYSYIKDKKNLAILKSEEEYYYIKYKNLIESEIEILKRIDHENIIKFFSSNMSLNIYIIKIEYCLYGDLYSILKEQVVQEHIEFKNRNIYNGFNNKFVINFINDISKAISYIHNLNIIHRDIKLHNILCSKSSNSSSSSSVIFKLSDFGFACLDPFEIPTILSQSLNKSDIDFSATSLKKKYYKLCGTPYYMAPEIILNIENFEQLIGNNQYSSENNVIYQANKIYDSKIDLWSFGICLYELIFNKLPFDNCLIDSIHDLIVYFSELNSNKNQNKIFKNINKEYNGKMDKKTNLLLKRLLTIDPAKRLLSNELLNFNENFIFQNEKQQSILQIKDEFENDDLNWEKVSLFENENKKVNEKLNHLDSEFPEFISSWDKINKASSLIMKVSVDNNFMKWLLTKKK